MYLPPTLRSILIEGAVKPSGPYQRWTMSGSVHACQTFSRGASNSRVTTISLMLLCCLTSHFVFPFYL